MKCANCERRIIGRSKKQAERVFNIVKVCKPCYRIIENYLGETDFDGLLALWENSRPVVR